MPNFIINTSRRAHAKAQLGTQLTNYNNNKKIYDYERNRIA